MSEVIEVSKDETLENVDLIIESKLNAHVDARLRTIEVKMERVLEVATKFEVLMDDFKVQAEEITKMLEASPIFSMLKGGSLPGFDLGSFTG